MMMQQRTRRRRSRLFVLALWLLCSLFSSQKTYLVSSQPHRYQHRRDNDEDTNDFERRRSDFGTRVNSSLSHLGRRFSYPVPPRDALQGLSRAVVNVVQGVVGGLLAVLACPVVLAAKLSERRRRDGARIRHAVAVVVVGLLQSVFGGVGLPVAGVLSGLRQLSTGLARTPAAVRDRLRGKLFDPSQGTWEWYRLDDELTSTSRRSSSDGDYYALLGVDDPRAAPEEIRRAYRRAARRDHPDKNPDDRDAARRFAALARAYETLSDERRRRRYDAASGADDADYDGPPGARDVLPALLRLGERAEAYVGDLRAATWLDAASDARRRNGGGEIRLDKDALAAAQNRREARAAATLRTVVAPYATGEEDDASFAARCREEARAVAGEWTGEGTARLLETIGRALVLEARVATAGAAPHRYAAAAARTSAHSWTGGLGLVSRLLRSVYRGARTAARARERLRPGRRQPSPEELLTAFAEALDDEETGAEGFSSDLLELARRVVLWDVSQTIKRACDKLLRDASTTTDPDDWRRRARGIETLGEEFLRVAEETRRAASPDGTVSASSKAAVSVDEILEHVQVSYLVAANQKKGIKVTKEERERIVETVRAEKKKTKRTTKRQRRATRI